VSNMTSVLAGQSLVSIAVRRAKVLPERKTP
jgi:hypothetical protein